MSSPATAVTTTQPARVRYVYGYSFDRETFRGRYPSRQAAVEAAHAALPNYPAIPEAIYVGRRIDPKVPVDHLGSLLIDAIGDRAMDSGDLPIDVDAVDREAREDLDARVATTLQEWLQRHDLIPPGRIEEISEHPLPLIHHVPEKHEREVGLIGVEG